MRVVSSALIYLAVLMIPSAESRASYNFNVDEGAHANFSLQYTLGGDVLDVSPYSSFDIVFADLQINNQFLVLRGSQLSGGRGEGESIFLFSDGPQTGSIPLTSTPNPVDSLWVTIGGFNSRDQAAQHVSGVISEIRLRPRDSSVAPLLVDDFSGPAAGISQDHNGGSGISRKQIDIDPSRVLGGERNAGVLLYRNENPGVTGASFTIDGDGTGRHEPLGVVPEPSSRVIWMLLLGIAWRVKTRWI